MLELQKGSKQNDGVNIVAIKDDGVLLLVASDMNASLWVLNYSAWVSARSCVSLSGKR